MGDTAGYRRSGHKTSLTNGFIPSQLEEHLLSTSASQPTMSFISTDSYFPENDVDSVRETAKVLAKDIVWNYVQVKSSRPSNKHAATLRRTVNEIITKHEILFKSMVNKLDIDESNGYSTFLNVVEEMFLDSAINWGRLVSVYAFAAVLAKYAKEKGLSDSYVERISELSGNYVANKLGKWIASQGGWEAFDAKFPDSAATEQKLWKGLLFTMVGLGALATMVAVR